MPRRYDAQREQDLTAQLADLDTRIDSERTRLGEEHQTRTENNTWDENSSTAYLTASANLRNDEQRRFQVKSELDDLLFTKPDDRGPKAGEPGTVERALRGGMSAVGEDVLEESKNMLTSRSLMATNPGDGPGLALQHFESPRQALFAQRRRDAFGAVQSDGSSGSNMIDTQTAPTIVDTLAEYGGALEACSRVSSALSTPLRIPQVSAESQMGVCLSSQNTTATELQTPDPTYAELTNYTFHSRWIEITNEMIEDTGFDLVHWVFTQLQRRLGRIMNQKFTVGTGSNEPLGFMHAPLEFTAAGQTAIVFPDEMTDLEYNMDHAFLDGEKGPGGLPAGSGVQTRDGMVGYTFHRKTEGYLRKAKTTEGIPLWQPNIQGGAHDMINGWPYVVNNDIANIAAGNKSVCFGNFGYHCIRMHDTIALWNFFDSGTASRNVRRLIGYTRADAANLVALNSNSKYPSLVALKQAA